MSIYQKIWPCIIVPLALALAATTAQASYSASVGGLLAFEYAPNGRSLDASQPWAVRGGYRIDHLDLQLEISGSEVSQGTPMIQVSRIRQEALVWARYTLVPHWSFLPYAAVGAGVQRDQVETVFGVTTSEPGETRRDTGGVLSVVALGAGVKAQVTSRLELDLSSRLGVSSGYAPNPQMSFAFFVGWIF